MTARVISICDLSSAAMNAAWRAAFVARELGARLHILHPATPARCPASDAMPVRELVRDIVHRTGVETTSELVAGSVLRRAVAASREAVLIVLPSTRGHPLREWIMGTPAERLVRLCRAPVLVVRRPALASYRRVLVAVDLEERATPLIRLACSLAETARAQLLHVVDASDEAVLREMGAAPRAVDGWREHLAQGIFVRMHQLIALAGPHGAGAQAHVVFGRASEAVIEHTASVDAELVAIGKGRRGLLADYFLGALTQRVLMRASADVLVHPTRVQHGSATRTENARPLLDQAAHPAPTLR